MWLTGSDQYTLLLYSAIPEPLVKGTLQTLRQDENRNPYCGVSLKTMDSDKIIWRWQVFNAIIGPILLGTI
jgi:hypothetical protein